MIHGMKVVVVMPACKAETLERTYREIPYDIVDVVILVDDARDDQTIAVAERLNLNTFTHEQIISFS